MKLLYIVLFAIFIAFLGGTAIDHGLKATGCVLIVSGLIVFIFAKFIEDVSNG